jgi:hypothetical protein
MVTLQREPGTFWDLMLRNVYGQNLRELDFITHPSRKYQVFEVLVVDILRRWSSGIKWEVTPVSADAGIDFTGERESLQLSVFGSIELRWKIVGQVKRMRTPKEETLMRALAAVRELARHETISGVMLVISSDVKAERVTRMLEKETLWHEFTGPKWHIPAERFLACLATDRARLARITAECYSITEHQIIESFLEQVPGHFDPEIIALVDRPDVAQAGRFIRCSLSLRSLAPLPQIQFRLRHRPAAAECNIVEVARPSRLASSEGVQASLVGTERRNQIVWLRSFAPGKRLLGTFEVLDLEGRLCTSINLGEIEIKSFFEPPYFDAPNQDGTRNVAPKIDAALSGRVEAVAVTGAGGAGKSRFCERIVDLAVDSGFTWVSIGQENAHTNGRRMLSRLMAAVAVCLSDAPTVTDDILCAVGRSLGRARPMIVESVRAYLCEDSGSVDQDHIATALLALIVEHLRDSPLVIHLHDLHWAGAEAFTILGLVLDYLRRNEGSLRHGVLFVFEGRSRESLLDAETQTFRIPEEWFSFLRTGGFDQIRIRPWTREECSEYLTRIFEVSVDRAKPVEVSALPLYDELIAYVRDHAQGNPMHLIEQLKRLYELGIVLQRENGLLYVHSALPQSFDTPRRVEDLIRARIDHYQRLNSQAIELMAVLARIGRRVPGTLFAALTQQTRLTGDLFLLEQMDVATIPRDGSAAFEFVHENYFQVFRSLGIDERSRILRAAIRMYDGLGDLSIQQKAEFIRLNNASGKRPSAKILNLVVEGLRESRVAEDDFLLEEFIRRFLAFDAGLQQKAGIDPVDARYELAEIMTRIGNWSDARRELEALLDMAASRPGVRSAYHCIRSKAELANVCVSLQDADAAVRAADEGLQLVESILPDAGELRPALIRLREKLWHRKAVAMWFDGRATDAIRWQWYSYRSIFQRDEKYELATVLREIGTILLHRNPRFGNRLLERALNLGRSLPQFHHGALFIIEAQLLMGRLLDAVERGESAFMIEELHRQAEIVHHRCLRQLTRYEATIAALVCGAAAGYLLKLEEAHHWFRTAANISVQSGLEEEIWKSRLNLAQVAFEMGRFEESRVNAEEAATVILRGLMTGSPANREPRRSLMMLPLAHIIRLSGFQVIADAVHKGYAGNPSLAIPNWDSRPRFRSRVSQQVLHVRRNQSDYFLMN